MNKSEALRKLFLLSPRLMQPFQVLIRSHANHKRRMYFLKRAVVDKREATDGHERMQRVGRTVGPLGEATRHWIERFKHVVDILRIVGVLQSVQDLSRQ